jgi:hypothetical protein
MSIKALEVSTKPGEVHSNKSDTGKSPTLFWILFWIGPAQSAGILAPIFTRKEPWIDRERCEGTFAHGGGYLFGRLLWLRTRLSTQQRR